MSAALMFAMFGDPTLWDLQQRSLAESGLDDGFKGRKARSDQTAYTGAYERGRLFRDARERLVVLTFGPSCRCPSCGMVAPGIAGGLCGCTTPPTPLSWGMEAMYGPGDMDDECLHFEPEDLRRLALEGVPVVTMEGERLNEQILVQ